MYNINDKSSAIRESKKQLFAISEKLYPQIPRTTIDGFYDEETRTAVKEFQKIKGFTESGNIDFNTFNEIYNDYKIVLDAFYGRDYIIEESRFPLGIGDMSEDVRTLHIIINELANTYPEIQNVGTGNYYSKRTGEAIKYLRNLFIMEESDILDRILFARMLTELDAIRRADKKPAEDDLNNVAGV